MREREREKIEKHGIRTLLLSRICFNGFICELLIEHLQPLKIEYERIIVIARNPFSCCPTLSSSATSTVMLSMTVR